MRISSSRRESRGAGHGAKRRIIGEYFGGYYRNTADIYSLGIVLYTLLNDNNPPFCVPETVSGSGGKVNFLVEWD